MRNIAIIPARSGSKGLKDKNIKELAGKPMMAYTIEAALKSGCFDEVHVSTDSQRYAEIACEHGANVPFLRSSELSGDTVGTWDVVKMVLQKYEKEWGMIFTSVAVLQPTSPLRDSLHIKEAYRFFMEKQADFIVGVCEAEHSPLWMNTLPTDRNLNHFLNLETLSAFRQGLPRYYRINGAIYIGRTEYVQNNSNYYGEKSYAYIMNKKSSIDVDDAMDFGFAEYLLKGENMWI